MKRIYIPQLRQFAELPFIPRTPESDEAFQPLAEMGMVEPTMSHCWKLTVAGQEALDEDAIRMIREKTPPLIAPE